MSQFDLKSLASGIFLSTFVLATVFYMGGNGQPSNQTSTFSEKLLKEYLIKNDKMLISKDKYQALLDVKKEKIPSQEKSMKNHDKQTNKYGNNDEQDTTVDYILSVKPGMNSIEIAKILEEKDIIDNAKNFSTYLERHHLNRFIQIGTYDLHSGMSLKQLANVLTKRSIK